MPSLIAGVKSASLPRSLPDSLLSPRVTSIFFTPIEVRQSGFDFVRVLSESCRGAFYCSSTLSIPRLSSLLRGRGGVGDSVNGEGDRNGGVSVSQEKSRRHCKGEVIATRRDDKLRYRDPNDREDRSRPTGHWEARESKVPL